MKIEINGFKFEITAKNSLVIDYVHPITQTIQHDREHYDSVLEIFERIHQIVGYRQRSFTAIAKHDIVWGDTYLRKGTILYGCKPYKEFYRVVYNDTWGLVFKSDLEDIVTHHI